MAQPVWILSVDLQTKTATFQSGMADAAKAARGAFNEIKSGSGEMAQSVGNATGSARQAAMLLGDEFGIHLPRGLTMFIASLGPVGAALEAAFPFVAIALGATLLLEHLAKMKQAGEQLTLDQVKFGTAAQNAFNSLDEKLLQAGIRADELRNDHIGALKKQLELINMQSMDELMHEFGEVAKAADIVFADLHKSWYELGSGSAGAKHSLDEFTAAYGALIAKRDDKGATHLLDERIARETKILSLQQQAAKGGGYSGAASGGGSDPAAQIKFEQTIGELKAMNATWDASSIEAQKVLVDTLKDQLKIEGMVGQQKKQDGDNAKTATSKIGAAESAAAAKAAADSQLRIAQSGLSADRATADSKLAIARASIKDREQVELDFAQRELEIQLTANKAEIAALNKMAADYPNALRSLNQKSEEITADHAAKVAQITSKAAIAQAAKDVQDIESSEREKIQATDEGTAARLAVIAAAIQRERSLNLQDTNFYRELQTEKAATARKAAEDQAKQTADLGRVGADENLKMGELALAAANEHQALIDSARRMTARRKLAEEIEQANQLSALKLTHASQDIANLNKSDKDYEIKLAQGLARQRELIQEHENEITAIKEKAQAQQNQQSQTAITQFESMFASGFTEVLMGHKSFASMMDTIGNQVVSGMLRTALMSLMTADLDRERQAASAARAMFLAGTKMPFPANIVMAPALGALAFASVMAYQDGTDRVPGSGRGDKIPAMLEPGEGVVPGGVMDGLRNMARSGQMGGGQHYHVHTKVTLHASALDGDGMASVLEKHGEQLQTHVERAVRKLNR